MLEVEELYRRCFPIIRAKCARMLGDAEEARDIAQETFLRLVDADLGSFEPRAVSAWIYTTSTHLAISRLRKRKSRKEGSALDSDTLELADSADLTRSTEARATLAEIAHLAPVDALEAAILHRIDGLTHGEVAEIMKVSERTVRRLLARFDAHVRPLQAEVADPAPRSASSTRGLSHRKEHD